ncbi:MAG: ABC transporter ATP-binding protein, partial [Gammaproteobacteria bacterium]|nr:ABC transporter ATP-binding protein [Gammaproteobacteria bacterium]
MPSANDVLVRFENVQKSYDGESLVVKDFNLDMERGEFLTMLGPSGSGKTTCLMMLAGFEPATSGEIYLSGKPINRTPPHKRGIGMVFQNYALFPHMTVGENLAFPLEVRGMGKSERETKVTKALDMVQLGEFANRRPGQLSGGQAQRVAVARALVFDPDVVLMDEPLGALDKNLREQMQYEIKHIHETLQVTVLYVTHDQSEALTMSNRVAVFDDGVVQQLAPPDDLYEKPTNAFVADFIGDNNRMQGTVTSANGETCQVKTDDGSEITAKQVNIAGEGK